jgi:glycosyltransferase involved in cell wall biosynthesis
MAAVGGGLNKRMGVPRERYHILMIAPTSFFADYGSHVRILEEARILQRLGNRITLCTYHSGQDVDDLVVVRTAGIPWRKGYEIGSSWHKLAFDAFLTVKCATVVRQLRPDVIHAFLHEGALIGYLLSLVGNVLSPQKGSGLSPAPSPVAGLSKDRVPLVFDFQGSLTSEMVDHKFLQPDSLSYRLLYRLEGVIARLPQALIANSHHAAELLVNQFSCDRQKIHIVPDCVDSDRFSPDVVGEGERLALRAGLGIPPEFKVVAYLGLLAQYQGIDLLLQAAAHLLEARSDAHFLIMGFPNVEHYQEMARQLGVAEHVTFTGRVPYEKAPSYLALGDVAVAPKISATEGSGKLLNYMAMGLPVVAFDTPVSQEYLGEQGVYVPLGDTLALAEALEALLDDPRRGMALGQQLRERATHYYLWPEAGEKILQVYREICGERANLFGNDQAIVKIAEILSGGEGHDPSYG